MHKAHGFTAHTMTGFHQTMENMTFTGVWNVRLFAHLGLPSSMCKKIQENRQSLTKHDNSGKVANHIDLIDNRCIISSFYYRNIPKFMGCMADRFSRSPKNTCCSPAAVLEITAHWRARLLVNNDFNFSFFLTQSFLCLQKM